MPEVGADAAAERVPVAVDGAGACEASVAPPRAVLAGRTATRRTWFCAFAAMLV